jgi:hypothetical protein
VTASLAPFCFGAGGPAGLGGEWHWKTGGTPFSLGALSPGATRRATSGGRREDAQAPRAR